MIFRLGGFAGKGVGQVVGDGGLDGWIGLPRVGGEGGGGKFGEGFGALIDGDE